MDINKKNREYLKGRFKKNAIPTETDFADLIEAAANQKDDGVARPPGDALCIEASAAGAHPALKLYDAAEANPAWVVNLRSGDPAAGQKGLVVSDGAGNPRLTIDQPSGALTIGALNAAGKITASGGLAIPAGQSLSADALTASGPITANGGLTVAAGQSLSALGSAFIAGDLRMTKSVVRLGTPDGTAAGANEVVGAIGFLGFGRSHGQLSYRAGAGFELIDCSADAPSLGYADGSKPYADLKLRSVTASGAITASAINAPTNQSIVLTTTGDGAVAVNGVRVDGSRSAHLDVDGAFYRTGEKVYLTVDDDLFVRRATTPSAAFQFDTINSRLGVGKINPTCALDVQGAIQATGEVKAGSISLTGSIHANGEISADNGIRVDGNRSAHLEVDGALYRVGGEVYLTVDDSLYVRSVGGGTPLFHFDLVRGRFGVGKTNPACALDVQGDIQLTGKLTAVEAIETSVVTTGTITAGGNNGTGLFVGRADSPGFHFDTANSRLGVGKVRPECTLDVNGDIQTTRHLNASSISAGLGNAFPADGTISCRQLVATENKQFQIDHPFDPVHKTLAHACLEGPEVGVYYRGEGQLTAGRSVITLPSYFEALTRNESRTVMITPRCEGDEPISPLAATAVTDGRFTVRAIDRENPSQRFYWEVKAVRGDVPELEVEFLKKGASPTSANTADAM